MVLWWLSGDFSRILSDFDEIFDGGGEDGEASPASPLVADGEAMSSVLAEEIML